MAHEGHSFDLWIQNWSSALFCSFVLEKKMIQIPKATPDKGQATPPPPHKCTSPCNSAWVCPAMKGWMNVPLGCPAPLPCRPATRPGSPSRPSAPHPPLPKSLALLLWAGHLQGTHTKKEKKGPTTKSAGQIWLGSHPYSHWLNIK